MELKMIEKTGVCPFCLQGKFVQIPEDDWDQYGQMAADLEATRTCNCPEGKEARTKRKALEICEENIDEMLKTWPEVADLLQEAKNLVYNEEKIRRIQITLPGGDGIVTMSFGNTGLKIQHKKVQNTELSSGF